MACRVPGLNSSATCLQPTAWSTTRRRERPQTFRYRNHPVPQMGRARARRAIRNGRRRSTHLVGIGVGSCKSGLALECTGGSPRRDGVAGVAAELPWMNSRPSSACSSCGASPACLRSFAQCFVRVDGPCASPGRLPAVGYLPGVRATAGSEWQRSRGDAKGRCESDRRAWLTGRSIWRRAS
jgi:hypothetical protein